MDEEGRRQTWLAQRVGMDAADINRAINRGMILDPAKKQAIADVLDRKVEELWPDEQQVGV